MIELHSQHGRISIRFRTLFMGDDLCILIDGGDQPHIGASSITSPQTNGFSKTICLPHHKENIITNKVSQKICSTTNRTTCCVCGIHIDSITKEEIEIILHMIDELTDSLLVKLKT